MLKWIKIKIFIKKMRVKHNRYDFKIVTTNKEIIIYVDGTDEQLRLHY
ncbi:MAG: hypothetical protein IPO21_14500 [Bacteroidales bacterium]|nr:hypothetical protein [Bacteroidales bacterium]